VKVEPVMTGGGVVGGTGGGAGRGDLVKASLSLFKRLWRCRGRGWEC
jgi:hypothetical protein